MKAERLTTLVAEVCLAEDRPLADELRTLRSLGSATGASLAASGNLKRALLAVGFERDVAELATGWPRATRSASRLLDRLPSPAALNLPLLQTGAYFLLILLVQGLVGTVLKLKVLPTLSLVGRTHHVAGPFRWEVAQVIFIAGLIPLAVLGVAAALGWRRMPGWGRHLTRARQASLAAALLETGAPAEVFSAWVRRNTTVLSIGDAAHAEDLLTIAGDSAVRADQAMTRLVTFLRFVGFGVLTVLALGLTADVYFFVASLAQAR